MLLSSSSRRQTKLHPDPCREERSQYRCSEVPGFRSELLDSLTCGYSTVIRNVSRSQDGQLLTYFAPSGVVQVIPVKKHVFQVVNNRLSPRPRIRLTAGFTKVVNLEGEIDVSLRITEQRGRTITARHKHWRSTALTPITRRLGVVRFVKHPIDYVATGADCRRVSITHSTPFSCDLLDFAKRWHISSRCNSNHKDLTASEFYPTIRVKRVRNTEISKEMKNQTYADYVKTRRAELGLSLQDVTDISGLHFSYWCKIEAGNYSAPTPKYLKIIAKTLQVPIEDLYGLVGYDVPERLPSFTPYLRAKYDLPPEAIGDLERYFEFLRNQYGIPKDQPVFPPKVATDAGEDTASKEAK